MGTRWEPKGVREIDIAGNEDAILLDGVSEDFVVRPATKTHIPNVRDIGPIRNKPPTDGARQ